MKPANDTITFRQREFRGSRLRCLLLTGKSRDTVHTFLQALVAPHAVLDEASEWMPGGFLHSAEVRLEQQWPQEFLTENQREELAGWWLKRRQSATTPTWDIVSICKIDGKAGLVLVEAKAHAGELGADDSCKSENAENRQQIADAMSEANAGLNAVEPGWSLQRDSHYQLSNRFALSWKIASMGTPVVLVYLGFLDAWDMNVGARNIFESAEAWRECLLKYAHGFVPSGVWEKRIEVAGTPLIPIIRSARVEVSAAVIQG